MSWLIDHDEVEEPDGGVWPLHAEDSAYPYEPDADVALREQYVLTNGPALIFGARPLAAGSRGRPSVEPGSTPGEPSPADPPLPAVGDLLSGRAGLPGCEPRARTQQVGGQECPECGAFEPTPGAVTLVENYCDRCRARARAREDREALCRSLSVRND